jgi:Tol biopolymer transport system component
VGGSIVAFIVSLLVSAFGPPPHTPDKHLTPPGPRIAFAAQAGFQRYEIGSVEPGEGTPFRLAAGERGELQLPMNWTSRITWSRDGESFAFAGAPPDAGRYGIFVGETEGRTPPHLVPRSLHYHYEEAPILSPDGRSVVIELAQGEEGWAFFALPVDGGKLRRLTPTSEDLYEPSGFTPDGKALTVTRFEPGESQAATVALGSGSLTVLAKHAAEPVIAADGTLVMARSPEPDVLNGDDTTTVHRSELLVRRPDSPTRDVLTVKGGLAWPSLDPSGRRIVFTTLEGDSPAVLAGKRNEVDEVNLDGSCLTKVASGRGETFAGATWRPDPGGRGPGPIRC